MSVADELAKVELQAKVEKEIEQGKGIKLAKMVVLPRFEGLSVKLHPAIDVVNGQAVVGVTLPCVTVDPEGSQEEREMPFLITSDRQKILCAKETLAALHWRLAYRVVSFENRWSLEGIRAWLEGATVNPSEVYESVRQAWQQYIEFDNQDFYDLIALWSIGTYFFHLFNTYPYIYVGGLKRTGKTKILTVASFLCFNAIFTNNISTASLYRLTQSGRCTLLLDETEKLSSKERAEELRNLLLAGYKKGAPVYRTEKKSGERLTPEAFHVYSPKIICNISGIEDVLEDRCIPIIMKRGKNRDIINREPDGAEQAWIKIRDNLYMLYLQYALEFSVDSAHNAVSVAEVKELSSRDLELWRPLLHLAAFFDKYNPQLNLSEKIMKLAKEITSEKQTENITETGEYILVQTLLKIVDEDRFYPLAEIKKEMAGAFDEVQSWLQTKWIGRALKRLGFKEKRRVGRGVEYRLTPNAVADLAQRLNIPQPESSLTSTSLNALSALTTLTEWLVANKDDEGLIDIFELTEKITQMGLDPRQIIDILKADGWLADSPQVGKMAVLK
jgi:predicted RNA binding protein YcfA (HicA-like mRNA interferase family)